MISFTEHQRRRELYIAGGWNIAADDDLPHAPECNPLDSAQRKRYLKLAKAIRPHRQPDSGNVVDQRAVAS